MSSRSSPPWRRKVGWRHSPLKQTTDSLPSNQSAVQCLCILDRDACLYWLFANVISLSNNRSTLDSSSRCLSLVLRALNSKFTTEANQRSTAMHANLSSARHPALRANTTLRRWSCMQRTTTRSWFACAAYSSKYEKEDKGEDDMRV